VSGEDGGVNIEFPDSVLEAIAARAAELVLEQLGNTNGSTSPWLSLAESSNYLRVSERQLQRLVARGKVRSTTIGRRRLLHRDDLDKLATGEETAPTAPPRRLSE
jgi:excisionase family DNA binding protein